MKWEYKSLKLAAKGLLGGKIDETELEMLMNMLGAEGWELVSSFVTAQGSGMTRDVFILFKRQID